MLNKRTNILFEDKTWQRLSEFAKKQNTSVGVLIRYAVDKTFFRANDRKEIIKAIETVIKIRKTFKKINYKELINYGRKY